MKILVALLYPLIASLLLPSDSEAQRDNSKEEQFPSTAYYFSTPMKQRMICAICESLFNVSYSDCSNNLNEARAECILSIRGNRTIVGRLWNEKSLEQEKWENEDGFPVEPYNYFNTPKKLRRICNICKMMFDYISANDCYKDQNEARDRCERIVFEMPNSILRKWNENREPKNVTGFPVKKPFNYFDSPYKLRRICTLCKTMFDINDNDCYNGLNEARVLCKRVVAENQNVTKAMWNQQTSEMKTRTPAAEKDLPALPSPIPDTFY